MGQSQWALLEADAKMRVASALPDVVEHTRPGTCPDAYSEQLAYGAEQHAANRLLYGAVLMQAVEDMHDAGYKMNKGNKKRKGDAREARDFLSGSSPMLRLCEETVGITAASLLGLSLEHASALLTHALQSGSTSLQPHHLSGMALLAQGGCWQTIPHTTGNKI